MNSKQEFQGIFAKIIGIIFTIIFIGIVLIILGSFFSALFSPPSSPYYEVPPIELDNPPWP